MKNKKILSLLIVLTMIAATVVLPMAASAATAKKTMNIGTGVISAADEKVSNRDIIYYGNQTKWRVLSTNGNTTDGDTVSFSDGTNTVSADKALFVISENDFGERAFNSNNNQNWQGSDAQTWCNGTGDGQFYKTAGITNEEKAAILTTEKSDSDYESAKTYYYGAYRQSVSKAVNGILNDKVFYISAKEAETYFNRLYIANQAHFKPNGSAAVSWWLRSPQKNSDPDSEPDSYVGVIRAEKAAATSSCVTSTAANSTSPNSRPAFNLNKENILFTSAANFDGTIKEYTGNEWKLTLKDSTRSITIDSVSKSGNTVTVSYSGATTGENAKVSYVVTDSTGTEIISYGNYGTTGSGSIDVTISDHTNKIFVFSEQVNDAKKTNFASELKEVAILSPVTVNVNVNDTMGSVTVSPEKPAAGKEVTLTATAKDGYKFTGFTSSDVIITTNGTTGTFTMPNKDVTVTANFEAIKLTASVNDSNMGSVTVSPEKPAVDKEVTLTATAKSGYKFVGFTSSDVTITTNGTTGTFTMPNKDVTVTANFEAIKLTASVNDSNMGSVTVSPEKPAVGKEVTLTATAKDGYKLVGFTSDDIEKLWISENECMFTMPEKDITVTAYFAATTGANAITAKSNFEGMGTVTSNKATAAFGEEVTLTAVAKPGNTFVEFASPDVNIGSDGKFIMPDKAVYVQAIFKADASFEDNTSTPIQAQKNDDGTAILRFMWGLTKADGAYLANIGAYIIPWDLFDNKAAAKPAVVLVPNPAMKSGDTFSADYINIPEAKFDTDFCAIPFINGTFFTDALLYGNVNQYDVNNNQDE